MMPATYRTIAEIRQAVKAARDDGKRIGCVPTMGALHEGHARLIETAACECDFVVVSIFVNPTQFGPTEDFNQYPRTLAADVDICGRAGAGAVFAPTTAEVYPSGFKTFVEVTEVQDVLCGASRPGHFRGVCTVVLKLFNIVDADAAYFGQKDAQQSSIIRRMTRDLNVPIEIRIVETVREPDGLAMSSRNRYLSEDQRRDAPAIYRSLQKAQTMIENGERDPTAIERSIAKELGTLPGLRLDYARVVSAETLQTPPSLSGPILIAVAAFLGTTRLIDNIQIDVPTA